MEKELSELTDQELLERKKATESRNIINAVILGVLAGIAIYSTITNGLGLMTFLPIIFAFFAASSWNKGKKTLKQEIESRNLK